MYDFAKEMNFDLKSVGKKSIRYRRHKITQITMLRVSASGVSRTKFLSSDPDEFCNSIKVSLQDNHAGNNSDMINEEIVAIVDKLLE